MSSQAPHLEFLFVGNHLALDFLNTKPLISGVAVELLHGGPAVAEWLRAAGQLSTGDSARLSKRWQGPAAQTQLHELIAFREELRTAVARIETGDPNPDARFIAKLDRLLVEYPLRYRLRSGNDGSLTRVARFEPDQPLDAFAVIADAAADLLVRTAGSDAAERCKLRQCKGCVLHFLDTSKKGNRQWCSMSMCGNRAKVAAFAERLKASEGRSTPKENGR